MSELMTLEEVWDELRKNPETKATMEEADKAYDLFKKVEKIMLTDAENKIKNLKKENEKLKKQLTKNKKPYERFLPCTCGCNRRDLWNVLDVHWYKCKKCGLTSSKRRTTAGAKKAWNSMIKARVKKNGNT